MELFDLLPKQTVNYHHAMMITQSLQTSGSKELQLQMSILIMMPFEKLKNGKRAEAKGTRNEQAKGKSFIRSTIFFIKKLFALPLSPPFFLALHTIRDFSSWLR